MLQSFFNIAPFFCEVWFAVNLAAQMWEVSTTSFFLVFVLVLYFLLLLPTF